MQFAQTMFWLFAHEFVIAFAIDPASGKIPLAPVEFASTKFSQWLGS